MRHRMPISIIGVVSPVATLSLSVLWIVELFWLSLVSIGEYRFSPEKRYTAHASNVSCDSMTFRRLEYIELRITESGSGKETWHLVYRHPIGAAVPDHGDRLQTPFIRWPENF